MKLTLTPLILAGTLLVATAASGALTSTNYSVMSNLLPGGAGHAVSARYAISASIGQISSSVPSSSLVYLMETGFVAQVATGFAAPVVPTVPVAISGQPTGSYVTKTGSSFTVVRTEAGKPATTQTLATDVPATSFTDITALKPNTIYQYAVTSNGDPSSTVFMTVRTPLYNGWNIVAVPYSTGGAAASTFFANPVGSIYQWNPTGASLESDTTQHGSYGTVTTLTPGHGYFAKASNSSTMLVYSGAAGPSSTTVTLKPGWTMIADPNTTNKTDIGTNWLIDGSPLGIAIVDNKIGGSVYWWNGTTYESWTILGQNPQIEPWKGYWIINLDSADHVLTIQ